MKYKIYFSGFAYVEADSEEEAKDLYYMGDTTYEETVIDDIEEVNEFIINVWSN